jgi:hypothetical protein
MFVPLGARAEASRIASTVATATGVGRNRRIDRRDVIASSTLLMRLPSKLAVTDPDAQCTPKHGKAGAPVIRHARYMIQTAPRLGVPASWR